MCAGFRWPRLQQRNGNQYLKETIKLLYTEALTQTPSLNGNRSHFYRATICNLFLEKKTALLVAYIKKNAYIRVTHSVEHVSLDSHYISQYYMFERTSYVYLKRARLYTEHILHIIKKHILWFFQYLYMC